MPKTLNEIKCFDSVFQIFNSSERQSNANEILCSEAGNSKGFGFMTDSPSKFSKQQKKGIHLEAYV
jgi:hypothetical protein